MIPFPCHCCRWDHGKKQMIRGWFGEDGEIGGVSYKIEDKDTLRGPGVSRSSQGEMKGTVTVKRTGDDRYTVQMKTPPAFRRWR